MDKTITRAPTWAAFLVHAALNRAPWRLALLPAAGAASLAYLAGRIDRAGLKQATQRLMLGGAVVPQAMDALAAGFADRVARTGVLSGARARIAADRAEGYRIVLATASHRYYAAAIAGRLGIADVVATEAKRDAAGAILPELEGENCYGPAKLRMVEAWMAGQGIARGDAQVRAYSDHVSDAPLLDWADEAFAVNAHGPLKTLATERGWPLLDWR
ncbi:MAG: HAD-IB family phosphatase [Sphingomonas sp.]|nr:HAD-IB family phosphatase [Sphingomonas sp.]